MGFLRRVLGTDVSSAPASAEPASRPAPPSPTQLAAGETASVRRIAAQLEMRPPAEARKLAAFAYILGRAANADYGVSDEERAEIATLVAEVGGVPAADAALVAELAGTLSWTDGATEDFLVAREYREISSPEERLALLRCCLLVVGIDDAIGAEEAWLINRIAEELDVPRPDVNHVRLEFMDRYTAIKDIRRDKAG